VSPKRELVQISFIVDTNCVNARQKIKSMNRLEQWAENQLISLLTAEIAQSEMAAGGNIQRIQKAYDFIYTKSEITTIEESRQFQEIENILFPNGANNQNEMNDVEIVFNAGKYCRPLITNDGTSKSQHGGMLGNRKMLSNLGISVITPEEGVERVIKALNERDDHASEWADYYGKELPEWVGKD